MRRSVIGLCVVFFGSVPAACGPSASAPATGADGGGDDLCEDGEVRCFGGSHQTCEGGVFSAGEFCDAACVPDLGCVACDPAFGDTCAGDVVVACNPDGSTGAVVETCAPGQCAGGACSTDCSAAGADLIYVVDNSYRLLSFDPRKLDAGDEPFALVGDIDCPAGPAWPEWGGGSTPFSMSVDRDAAAWVLYTSGEVFRVSTEDASCEVTGFQPGQAGFKLFGMGFVSTSAGGSQERLWIAGGPVDVSADGDLGWVDASDLQVVRVGELPSGQENSPELSGTGGGELYGYYPGRSSSAVARLDKATGQHAEVFDLPGLGDDVRAWAFAHWGGQFYIFVTTQDFFGFRDRRVKRFDPASGGVEDVLEDIPYTIVGAGVSTCAPVIVL